MLEQSKYQALMGKSLESMTFFDYLTVKENLKVYSNLKGV